MNLKSTIVGFVLLLILQIKLITSQELDEYASATESTDSTTIEPTSEITPLPEEDKSTNLPATESTYPTTIEVKAITGTTEVISTYAKFAREFREPVTSIAPKIFTSLPCKENSLEKLYSWSRNETSLNLFWFPSKTKFTHYIVSIEPPDSAEPIQIFKKKNIKFSDKVNVAFTDLHSSTFYNISLKKAYGAKILSETFMNWTTPPAQPLNLYVDESSITPKSFRIIWDTERLSSGADYYKLTVKVDDELYFYTVLEGDNEKTYEFSNFRSDTNYIIELTTVFNDESSNPAVTSVSLPSKNNRNKARSDRPSSTTNYHWVQPTDEPYYTQDDTAPEEQTSRNINTNTNININGKKK